MTTVTINRTDPAEVATEVVEVATEVTTDVIVGEPKSYLDLIQDHPWQTHLPPSPEGRLLASADYCTESGDIAHFILDPKSREIIAACINQPMEELRYFLKQENGLMAPVTKAESRKALDRLNAKAKIEWSYPPYTKGQPKPKRYRPMGPDLTPDFADMLNAHEWKTHSRRKFPDSGREKEHVQSSYFCGICLARMHTTRRNVALTQAWVRLPGMGSATTCGPKTPSARYPTRTSTAPNPCASARPPASECPAPRPANPDRDGEAAGKCPAEPQIAPQEKP